MAKTQILKASKHWREHGETSAGYLKRSIETRTSQRYIPSLQHPSDSHLCASPGELQDAAKTFYQHLYTSETIDDTNVSILLDTITDNDIIPADDTDSLLVPFTIEDLLVGSSRSPRKSSPGTDGLPYEILSLVLKHPGISNLAVKVYNDALLQGIFPRSGLSTSTALLPKKGDLTSLKNWRPISLINTDAKIFTRLLNCRLMSVFSSRISPHQMGFMPQRFIGEHGRLLQLIMSSASIQKSSAVGLLLDQEKAYDRVHPEYLSQVMRRFGVPAQLSFYSTTWSPSRLFVVASSADGSSTDGSSADDLFPAPVEADPPSVDPAGHSPPPVKILAYADDVLVFLKSPSDFNRLQQAVSIYASASNAMLNYSKTQAFSLSSDPNPTWQQFLITQNIHSWHDCRSTDSLIYLGYPVYSSTSRRNLFVDQLTNKIALSCQIHSQRNLSIRGRVTVLNCLIFSKLWHVLRIVPLTQAQIAKIQALQLYASLSPKVVLMLSIQRSKFKRCNGVGFYLCFSPLLRIPVVQHYFLGRSIPVSLMISTCFKSIQHMVIFPLVFLVSHHCYSLHTAQVTFRPFHSIVLPRFFPHWTRYSVVPLIV
ncbi:hypothetical protein G6F25_012277 [Rhizopus arrhizus]|nr:hypothetical protein G6F25_012277 [Rhizopus arrhizus]